uniref:TraB/GumN family protein n=1 Tax=Parerythrobacter lutipelagi TaxID=1964208 RepID=UPI0010F4C3F8|nr:TraB/GumN family protein [Parerythrobacter lutipelagi]
MQTFIKTFAAACSASLVLAGSAAAQQQKPTPVLTEQVSAADVEMAGPALWKVADEDTTIFLFGTVHALPSGLEWYTGPVREAFEASEMLVTEIPMQPQDEAKMQIVALTAGMLPEGTALRSLLDQDQRETFDAAMTRVGMPVTGFDRFEPWMAGLTLTLLPLMQQGYSPDQGVEKQLIALAGPDMQFGALETIEFQIGIFDSMPQEDQIEFLITSAEQVDDTKSVVDAMVAEWIEGDPDGLADVMNEGLESDPGLADALLYSRNANWAEWIDQRLDQPGSIFIAVGAGHLAGEKSVQDLLDRRGIVATRVQ